MSITLHKATDVARIVHTTYDIEIRDVNIRTHHMTNRTVYNGLTGTQYDFLRDTVAKLDGWADPNGGYIVREVHLHKIHHSTPFGPSRSEKYAKGTEHLLHGLPATIESVDGDNVTVWYTHTGRAGTWHKVHRSELGH